MCVNMSTSSGTCLGRRRFLAASAAAPALAGMSLFLRFGPRAQGGRRQGRPEPRSGASPAPIPAGSSRSATLG